MVALEKCGLVLGSTVEKDAPEVQPDELLPTISRLHNRLQIKCHIKIEQSTGGDIYGRWQESYVYALQQVERDKFRYIYYPDEDSQSERAY